LTLFLYITVPSFLTALPLTETIYTIPEDEIEISINEEILHVNGFFRKDRIGLGFGLTSDFSLWFFFDYLHSEIVGFGSSLTGDFFLKIKYYIGDLFDRSMHMDFFMLFRFPSGPDVLNSIEWRNLALGRNEIRTGLILQMNFFENYYIHMNFFYTFRESQGEGFYNGFSINPFSGSSYEKIFGLNPFSHQAFLSYRKMKNDYVSFSAAFNTDIIYPFIPFVDMYASFRLYRGEVDLDDIPVEGGSVDPVLISAGCRYFFSDSVYIGLYSVLNPLFNNGYVQAKYGVDLCMQF